MEKNFSDYEKKIIKEIAKHKVERNAVQKALELAGKPVEKIIDIAHSSKIEVVRKVAGAIQEEIQKGIIQTIKLARVLYDVDSITKKYNKHGIAVKSIEEIKELSLEEMDFIADRFDLSNAMFVGLEGAILGAATTLAESVPFAIVFIPTLIATDVSMSITLLSRHASQIAACYGYPSVDENIPHILAAMAPHQDSSEEGYLSGKAVVINSIREASRFIARNAGRNIDKQLIEREAPQLIKLINYLAERLGIIITQKELGMIVPISGAVLNGGINIAFQRVGHTTAKDYFRRLLLENKYGPEEIHKAVTEEIENLKTQGKKSAHKVATPQA